MEACLDEELPPTTELEEGLRNGVYLAKLGNFFAPHTVSLKKIYDREQTRYKVRTRWTTTQQHNNTPAGTVDGVNLVEQVYILYSHVYCCFSSF